MWKSCTTCGIIVEIGVHIVDEFGKNNDEATETLTSQLLQRQKQMENEYETTDYKKLLTVLALSVIGTTIIVLAVSFIYQIIAAVAGASPDRLVPYERPGSDYFFMWLGNALVTYLPPMLIFYFIFRKQLNYEKPGEPYEFEMWWVFPLFTALLATVTLANLVTLALDSLYTTAFGGEGLPDVFSEVAPKNTSEFLIMLLMTGLIAPICEEFIYRHLLLKPLRKYGDFLAIAVTSLLFGFFHANLTQFLYATTGGVLLGLIAVRANSVKPAIIVHALLNLFSVTNMYLLDLTERESISLSQETIGVFFLSLVVLGFVTLVIFTIKRRLHVENHNPYIPAGQRVRILFTRPSILIMLLVQIVITIVFTMLMRA